MRVAGGMLLAVAVALAVFASPSPVAGTRSFVIENDRFVRDGQPMQVRLAREEGAGPVVFSSSFFLSHFLVRKCENRQGREKHTRGRLIMLEWQSSKAVMFSLYGSSLLSLAASRVMRELVKKKWGNAVYD